VDALVDWSGVRDRVAAAVSRGAPGLHAHFEPVLTADEVAEVEAQCGVVLPEEYRSFLLEVGSGGPGPALELTTLSRIDGQWGWLWDTVGPDHPWRLDASGAFIENEQWLEEQQRFLRMAGHEAAAPDDEHGYLRDFKVAFGAYRGEELWHLHRERGAILISDNGCGMTSYLILVGPHRGELRFRDCAENPPYEPLETADGRRHNFYSWYMEWLEQHELRVSTHYPRS
jgi:hypothetical protein